MSTPRKVLFVRSGGGMPGLDIHAGIWRALDEAGIVATHCSGTSAGAIVSAMDAAGWDGWSACRIVNAMTDAEIRHDRPLWKLRVPWMESFLETDRIRAALDQILPARFDALEKPLSCWSVRPRDRALVNVARPELAPDVTTACLASMAIAGAFPRVTLCDGEDYIDGGVRFNLPLPTDWRDFDEVWLLIATGRAGSYRRVRGIIGNLLLNVSILVEDQVLDVLAETAGDPRVHVIRPDLPTPLGSFHFDHSLCGAACAYTRQFLATYKRLGCLSGDAP